MWAWLVRLFQHMPKPRHILHLDRASQPPRQLRCRRYRVQSDVPQQQLLRLRHAVGHKRDEFCELRCVGVPVSLREGPLTRRVMEATSITHHDSGLCRARSGQEVGRNGSKNSSAGEIVGEGSSAAARLSADLRPTVAWRYVIPPAGCAPSPCRLRRSTRRVGRNRKRRCVSNRRLQEGPTRTFEG